MRYDLICASPKFARASGVSFTPRSRAICEPRERLRDHRRTSRRRVDRCCAEGRSLRRSSARRAGRGRAQTSPPIDRSCDPRRLAHDRACVVGGGSLERRPGALYLADQGGGRGLSHGAQRRAVDLPVAEPGGAWDRFRVAVVLGIGIGLMLARFWVLDVALTVYITFLYSIPSVALVPLIVLWAG